MPRLRPAKNDEVEKADPKLAAAEEAPEVEVEETPEVEIEVTPQQDDATIALRKQIEDLKRSEQLLKDRAEQAIRDREEALQRARDREAQVVKAQKEAYDSQADAISSALAAAQAEADKAQLDIENAISLGDAKAQAEAQRRLSLAAANLARLEDGKEAAIARAKEAPAPAPPVDPIDSWGLPRITSDWLKDRRHLLIDQDKFDELKYFQLQAKRAGLTPHTKAFLEHIEVLLGEREAPQQEEIVVQDPPKKQPLAAAPVSRQVPNSNGRRPDGKVKLTPAEVEAARISGVTVEEYAKQKVRKAEMIASGEYGEQR